jgi:hypothetical protein
MEVVSLDEASEARSAALAAEVGVDMLMGGTRPAVVEPIIAGTGIRYFPFPGTIVGHPSVLTGAIPEIVASALSLTTRPGVHGLDLLAYRYPGDVEALIAAVVGAVRAPVVVAGSIGSPERIRTVARLGAWGFTIGSAILDGSFGPGPSVREQVELTLEVAAGGEPGS